MTYFKNCNIIGPIVEKNKEGKYVPNDMVDLGVLDPAWKNQKEMPVFDHGNVINFKIPIGCKVINCNVIPVDDESQTAAKEALKAGGG